MLAQVGKHQIADGTDGQNPKSHTSFDGVMKCFGLAFLKHHLLFTYLQHGKLPLQSWGAIFQTLVIGVLGCPYLEEPQWWTIFFK